ncbi:MAG: single-stranded DNA-binding protein [Mailhella sp.]|nr:single-stranded DNA-binding protein [Mailhella sp.]
MLNKAMIIGNLGADPEIRYSGNGTAICNLRIATDESYPDKDGNRVPKTEWHRVVVFNRQAESCKNFLSKGSRVFVEGKLQTRKWTDQNGAEHTTTEIRADRVQFLDRKSDRGGQGGYGNDAPFDDDRRNSSGRGSYGGRGGQGGYNDGGQDGYGYDGTVFPSEASAMDDAPF